MSIEAMKLALEALEEINKLSIGEHAICLPAEIDTAMDALRQAIEQAQKQEPVAWLHTKLDGVAVPYRPADLNKHPDRWEALYKTPPPCPTCEALARTVMLDQTSHDTSPPPRQPEQEPVAWMHPEWRTYTRAPAVSPTQKDGWKPLYTSPPVASNNTSQHRVAEKAKQRHEPLTDEQLKPLIQKAMRYYGHNPDHWHLTAGAGYCLLARAIEAKLKENT